MRTLFMHGNQEQKFVEAARRLAIKDKAAAETLVFEQGLRGEITTDFIRSQEELKNMFTNKGRLTLRGRAEVGEQMRTNGLKGNVTWDELLA